MSPAPPIIRKDVLKVMRKYDSRIDHALRKRSAARPDLDRYRAKLERKQALRQKRPLAALKFLGATLWNAIRTTYLGVPTSLVEARPLSHYQSKDWTLTENERMTLDILELQADIFDQELSLLRALKTGSVQLLDRIERYDLCVTRILSTCLNPTKAQKTYLTTLFLEICAAENIAVQAMPNACIAKKIATPRYWGMSIVDEFARLAKRHGYASNFRC